MHIKSKKVLLLGILVIVLGIIFIPRLGVFSNGSDKKVAQVKKQGNTQGSLPVSGCIAKMATSSNGIVANGLLLPNEEVDLVSETAGKVVRIYFEDGQQVKKGDLLLQVDASDLRAQLERAELELKLVAAKLERQRVLWKRESVSLESLQELETEYHMLQADIELLKVKIARTEIRAPFSGRMGFRLVSEGSYLQSSTRVSTLVDNSVMKIEFDIPEKYITAPLLGKEICFQADGVKDDIVAKVYAVDPQADSETHTIRIRARYKNTANVVAGMFVKGELITEENRAYIMIPTEAVVPEMGGKRLWVVRNGKAVSTPVETESRDSRYVEVVSGIQVGDTVLTGGLMQLRDGMKVKVTIK